MSIVIHGVSMPKDGKVLLIDPWGNVRLYWSKDVVAVGTGLYLCKASELPPHGRLIDADALCEGLVSNHPVVIYAKNAHTIIPEDRAKEDT